MKGNFWYWRVSVRDELKSYDEDLGWYTHPPGTVAMKARDAELARDSIDVSAVAGPGTLPSPAAPAPPSPGGGHRH